MADKPVTREEKYLAYLTGDYKGELPKPITRKEKYLYELCLKGIGGEISPEEIKNAVNEYLEKNPVKPGATTEQAQQIEQNKTDVTSLKTETNSLKKDLAILNKPFNKYVGKSFFKNISDEHPFYSHIDELYITGDLEFLKEDTNIRINCYNNNNNKLLLNLNYIDSEGGKHSYTNYYSAYNELNISYFSLVLDSEMHTLEIFMHFDCNYSELVYTQDVSTLNISNRLTNLSYHPNINRLLSKSSNVSNSTIVNLIIKSLSIPSAVNILERDIVNCSRIQISSKIFGIRIDNKDQDFSNTQFILVRDENALNRGGLFKTITKMGLEITIEVSDLYSSISNYTNDIILSNIKWNPNVFATSFSNMKMTPQFYSPLTLSQNYFDDTLIDKGNYPMLRTDTVILNQSCFGSAYSNPDTSGIKLLAESNINNYSSYKYFYWNEVQISENKYDFSAILNFAKDQYSNKRRICLRLFPSNHGDKSKATEYKNYKISFPVYVFDLMEQNNAQFVNYNDELLLDVNCDAVYEEYNKLLIAFGKWLETAYVDEVNSVKVKDILLYIDFGLIGPWGEGGFYDLQWSGNVEDIVRYVRSFVENVSDIQVNIGQWLTYEKTYRERNRIFIESKKLKNNVGYVGMFLDNLGSRNPIIFDSPIVYKDKYNEITSTDLYRAYANRGDFFTGEFAMWNEVNYWGKSSGLCAYTVFLLFKAPFFRFDNITLTGSQGVVPIKKVSQYIMNQISSALAIVGFRYIITILNNSIENKKHKVSWSIINTGCASCRFDIFKLSYLVKDLDSDDFTETTIDYDIRDIKPADPDNPLQYSLSNVKTFSDTLVIPYTNYSISIVAKDKLGLQEPLYFSNYGRCDDGSYLLYKSKIN